MEAKTGLLIAIRKAKRASSCGTVAKETPFQIVDHWDGIWELQVYEETTGQLGFSINRVCYAGQAAKIVAQYILFSGGEKASKVLTQLAANDIYSF